MNDTPLPATATQPAAPQDHDAAGPERPAAVAGLMIDVCSRDRAWADAVRVELGRMGALAAWRDPAELDHSDDNPPDLVLIDSDAPDDQDRRWASVLRSRHIACVVAYPGEQRTAERAMALLRAGAADYLPRSLPADRIAHRLVDASFRERAHRRREERLVRLERLCRRLNGAHAHLAAQAGSLCSDLVQAYEELAAAMNQATTAHEYQTLVGHELDIESLLRTTLEFVLARSGPTNAAVFLPTTSGDYSLGAYVNYDCPRDTVDILLDHLANVVAERFEGNAEPLVLTTDADLRRLVGRDADWLGDSQVIGLSCESQGETLAIILLFRDRKSSYAGALAKQMGTIGGLFAEQLARIIRIHHRHLPKEKWGAVGDVEDERDDYGEAA